MAVRWRAELLLTGAVAALTHYGGTAVLMITAVTATVLIGGVPVVRTVVVDIVTSVICMHRVRVGLIEAGVASRSGRIPWVVSAWTRDDITLVKVWLVAGTTVDDLRRATGVLATACGAATVEVHHRSLRQDRAVLAVARPRWGRLGR